MVAAVLLSQLEVQLERSRVRSPTTAPRASGTAYRWAGEPAPPPPTARPRRRLLRRDRGWRRPVPGHRGSGAGGGAAGAWRPGRVRRRTRRAGGPPRRARGPRGAGRALGRLALGVARRLPVAALPAARVGARPTPGGGAPARRRTPDRRGR